MDISDDSKLIVTCSADKNIKIWGLDFGDCHKSIFAHDESIMQVAFEKNSNSHYFWSVSKDKLLKYWDGDKVCPSIIPTCCNNADQSAIVREHPEVGWASRRNLGIDCQSPRQVRRHRLTRQIDSCLGEAR